MANFPSVTAAGAFESTAVQNAIKDLAAQAVGPFTGLYNVAGVLGLTSGNATWFANDGWAGLILENALPAAGTGGILTQSALATVAPAQPLSAPGGMFTDTGNARRAHLSYLGQVRVYNYVDGEKLTGSLIYPMIRPIPTTPPGIKL